MKKTFGRVAMCLLGCILLVSGVYEIYMGLYGNDKKEDRIVQNKAASIGEIATDKDGVDFCVTAIQDTQTIGEDYTEYVTDNNLIVVHIQIANNSNEVYDVNSLRFVLEEGDNEYEYSTEALYAFENAMYMDNINPGLSKEYVIVYETPYKTTEKDWRMKIHNNAFSEKNCVYIDFN